LLIIDLVIPTSDVHVQVLSRGRKQLRDLDMLPGIFHGDDLFEGVEGART